MSRRTFERLLQFDEPAAMRAMADFPHALAHLALKRRTADVRSIKLMRTALFLSIALDTGLRARNLVSIDIRRHLALFREGKKWKARLSVPCDKVKNGVDIVSELTPLTVQILRRWLDNFRPAGCAIDCSWLFPARSGGHLAGTHAYQDVRDLALRHLGLDITPHLIRSFIGKAMLDERPDSHADIQQILGHRQIKTTISFYAPVSPAQARRRYHESLGQLRGRS
ncbi:tyrosine-type recombinase/integrase [Acidiphilium sp.]|uniref:tyrosine-type recombinase/integrase n=1 Tax=Acidiphilium sp. TaxID=527 RepID=UPI00258CA65B|nr:tyrosine-type recombinase/integrase [Acidiphilium sp.]